MIKEDLLAKPQRHSDHKKLTNKLGTGKLISFSEALKSGKDNSLKEHKGKPHDLILL